MVADGTASRFAPGAAGDDLPGDRFDTGGPATGGSDTGGSDTGKFDTGGSDTGGPIPGGAPAAVGQRVRELVEFASYYVAAQTDRVKLTVINSLMFVVLGLIGAGVGLAVVATAGGMLVVGIAQAIGTLLWHQIWAGYLITSLAVIGGLVVGTIVVFKKVTKTSRERLVAAYEQRKSKQRNTLGTDVDEQSHR